MSGGGLELLPEWKRCHIFLKCPRGSWGGSGAPVSVDAGPQFPEASPQDLRRLRAPGSVMPAHIFLNLTAGPEETRAPVSVNAAQFPHETSRGS